MLRFFLTGILLCCSFRGYNQVEEYETPHERYIAEYKNIAVAEMKRSGVPASIKLAQGLLESSYGQSKLAIYANNHFGIKCKESWAGEYYLQEDDDYDPVTGKLMKSCFRKYPNVPESYRDHSNFLTSRPWYAPLFDLNTRDYKSWAYGLKEAGYATDPQYPGKLIARIEEWKLHRFDNEKPLEDIRETPPSVIPLPAQTISIVNGIQFVTAREGQTPNDISRQISIASTDIVKYNERIFLIDQRLKKEEYIFLQKKKKKYKAGKRYHQATGVEDLYQISQLYGVRLKNLAKRNRMDENSVPLRGERIKLCGWRVKKSKAPKWSFRVSEPPPSKEQPYGEIIYYTVQQGDTLYALARKLRTSVQRLKALNNLQNDNLSVGQVLKIR